MNSENVIDVSLENNSNENNSQVNFGDLSKLVFDTLTDEVKINKLQLDHKLVDVVLNVLNKYPEGVSKFQSHIKTILSDKVIDSDDIPHIVNMIRDMIAIDVKKLKTLKISKQNIIDFARVVLVVLIETDVIPNDSSKREGYISIINLCFTLLESNIDLVDSIDFSKCKSYFCCC